MDLSAALTTAGLPQDLAARLASWVPAPVVDAHLLVEGAHLDALVVTGGGLVWIRYSTFAEVEAVPWSTVRRVAMELAKPTESGETASTLVVELAGGISRGQMEFAWADVVNSAGDEVTSGRATSSTTPSGWLRTGRLADIDRVAQSIRRLLLTSR